MIPARSVRRASLPLVRLHRWLVMRPVFSIALAALAGFVLSAVLTVCRGFPTAPQVHDEFSYLLMSDTFVHGRLTNPPHPMWQHFESFHVLQQPTYASKYPPFAAVSLAIGQRLTGEPTVGVWIAFALLCGALEWMLQAWAPPGWALWGALFTALWLVSLHAGNGYWAYSFWGGATTATGGALLLGGLRRFVVRPSAAGSIAMAAGVGILVGTRPFDGLLAALPPSLLLAVWVARHLKNATRRRIVKALAPAVVLVALIAAFLAYYNFRVTGSMSRFPYMVYEQQYGAPQPLLRTLAVSTPPTYRHEVMRRYYLRPSFQRPRTVLGTAKAVWEDSEPVREFLFPFFVAPLLFLVPWVFNDRWTVFATSICAAVGGGLLLVPFIWQLHYVASLFPAYLLVLVRAARHLNALRLRRARRGRALIWLITGCAAASALLSIIVRVPTRASRLERWESQRQNIERELARSGSRHLVIVEYGPRHDFNEEWVYNHADIDGSPVVWARAMSPEKDAELIEYFSDRRTWKLCVMDDEGPFDLRAMRPPGFERGFPAVACPQAPDAPAGHPSPDRPKSSAGAS
jgi:hypothetical protein